MRRQCLLRRAHDRRRVGGCAPSVCVGHTFGRGIVVDDCLLLGVIDARERLFEEDLVGREGDLECRLKISIKAPVCGR